MLCQVTRTVVHELEPDKVQVLVEFDFGHLPILVLLSYERSDRQAAKEQNILPEGKMF